MTWEPDTNLSEDLVRDFEEAFWAACKAGNAEFLAEALRYGGATVANLANADGRSPLHFAAALNNSTLCRQLLDAGACCVLKCPPAAGVLCESRPGRATVAEPCWPACFVHVAGTRAPTVGACGRCITAPGLGRFAAFPVLPPRN